MEYGPWLFDLLGGRMAAATARIDFRRSLARLRGLWPVCGPHAADYARADCVVRRRSRQLSRGESKKSPRPGVGADECQHAPQQDRLGALGSPFARSAPSARPFRDAVVPKPDPLQSAGYGMGHDIVERSWLLVEGGHGRKHDAAHLGEGEHLAEVAEVKRRLAHEREQRAALLERHVSGTGEEGVGMGAGERGQGLDAAGGDDHPRGAEGAAGERGADVAVVVDDVGEGLDLGDGAVRLLGEGPLAGSADDQVDLDRRILAQLLESADAVDGARGPGDADDDPPRGLRHAPSGPPWYTGGLARLA